MVVNVVAPSVRATHSDSLTWEALSELFSSRNPLVTRISTLPGSGVVWRYIKSSHQNDPARTFLELLLVIFVAYTWLRTRTRGDKSNFVKLTEKEIEDLVAEWQPEPLMYTDSNTANLPRPPVIVGPPSLHPKVAPSLPDASILTRANNAGYSEAVSKATQEKAMINLAAPNFSGLAQNEHIKAKAIECLRSYGVGSCGPSGFYGFFDVHIELENALATFLGLEAAIIYPQGFTTVCSVIPSFSKRGDIIVADKGVNFAIQKGIQISRSRVRWYEHNDMDSLEEVLEALDREAKRTKAPLTRKFIVTEGLFEGDGQVSDLPRLIELKNKYKYRLMLDETWSMGVLGATGRGASEFYNLDASEIDVLMGSLAVGLCAGGGFCAGDKNTIAHQRINSAAYVFSASLPPLLAVAAHEGIAYLTGAMSTNGQLPLSGLNDNIKTLRTALDKVDNYIYVPSANISPLVHIHIRNSNGLSFYDQEHILQEIVDECMNNGVLISRTKKVWKQEAVEGSPSLRILVSAALPRKEMEKATNVLKSALQSKLAKRR